MRPSTTRPPARKIVSGAVFAVAGLLLAQLSGPSNLGVPAVPGTSTPESNPATAPVAPSSGPTLQTPSTTGSAPLTAPATPGPAASFGAAPAPIGTPMR